MAVKPVPLTGSVLAWAMADVGVSAAELAGTLGVAPDTVRAWTSESAQPTMTQFHALARSLHRPESFFFLTEAPSVTPVPVAYRMRVSTEEGQPGAASVEALRLAERAQRVASWVRDRTRSDSPKIPKVLASEHAGNAGVRLRNWLQWTVTDQTSPVSEANAAKAMRQRLQDVGLLVLHLPLGEDAVRGFSLPHESTPLLAVNTKDAYRARLFSYVHELAHLSLRDESVCLTRQNRGVESWCNRVAASLLMPDDHFRAYVRRRFGTRLVATTAEVGSLSNHYNVSLRAIAIRLSDLGLAGEGLYELVNREAEYRKSRGGTYNPERVQNRPRVRLQQYGRGFVNTLTDAEDAGVLARPQVLELLRVSTSELRSLREISATGQEG